MTIIINFPTFVFVKIIMCDSIMTHKFQGLFGKTTLLMWRTIFRILSILVIFLDVNINWLYEVSDRFRSYVSTILIEFMGVSVFIILTICFDQKNQSVQSTSKENLLMNPIFTSPFPRCEWWWYVHGKTTGVSLTLKHYHIQKSNLLESISTFNGLFEG